MPPALSVDLHVELGGGNDGFNAVMTEPPDPSIPLGLMTLHVKVLAGAGDDVLSFVASGLQSTSSEVNVQMDGGAGNDTMSAEGVINPGLLVGFNPQPEPPIFNWLFNMVGAAGNDTISLEGVVSAAVPAGSNQQPLPAIVNFTAAVQGGGGNDDVTARMGVEPTPFLPELHLQLTIDGGAGSDRLAVSLDGIPVLDDHAPAITITLNGGAGDDEMFGSQVDDLMIGGGGNDILVGGAGRDQLFGEEGGDILLGGATIYDTNIAALAAIMAEWTSSRSYAERVANLQNGIGNPNLPDSIVRLADTAVFDDGAVDILIGGNSPDWFFANLDGDGGALDQVADRQNNEIETDLDAWD